MKEQMKEKTVVEEKKPVKSVVDMLLGDPTKLKLPTKKVEITRLSQIYGSPFIVMIKAVSAEQWGDLQNMSVSVNNGDDVEVDLSLLQVFTVMECTYDEDGAPLFKNKALMKQLHAFSPKELVTKVLLSGEVTSLYNDISELSGFGTGATVGIEDTVKN